MNISSVSNFNLFSRQSFTSNIIKKERYEFDVPTGTKEVFVPADECLKAYNLGGMQIRIRDTASYETTKEVQPKEKFIKNMLMKNNLDVDGKPLVLCEELLDLIDQKISSETTEMRTVQNETKPVKRYTLEDGTVIDKDLYNYLNLEIKQRYEESRPYWFSIFIRLVPYKIDFGKYTFVIGRKSQTLTSNLINNENGDILVKKYRKNDGQVSFVMKSGEQQGTRYTKDGTQKSQGFSEKCTFFE